MSIEEKARAYDKALNWMRELYPGLHGATKEDAEHYFPELRESEDERIRKAIVLGIKRCADAGSIFGTVINNEGVNYHDVLAWLEKQKESNIDKLRRISTPASENWLEIQKQWEEEDKQAEQQPAEWSEEDEKLLDFWLDVIDSNDWRMDENFCKASREFINKLKSFRPQPKQEWSEEDEKMLKNILWVLESYVSKDESAASPSLTVSYPTYYKEIEWLKSLRPQPHWKPSKEEMEALDVACSGKLWYGEIYLEGLKRIREQLKKL